MMSERKHIVRAAGVLGFATFLSRIMGMVRDMVVSHLFGAGMATDAFFAAFQIPNMLRRFFAEGALTSAFVPTFSEWLTQKGEEEARELANICFTLLTIVMAAVTLIGIMFSPAIVGIMAMGWVKSDPSKYELTVYLNRMMFPYIFFVSLVALAMGILNTVRHFFTPAISTVFLNISMIVCAIYLHDHFHVPIVALAVGVLVGGFLQLLLQLPTLYRLGFPIRPRFNFFHPAVKRIALLMGPSVFGVGVYYLNITVGLMLASFLPQGSVSFLYYAQRLFEFPQGIFTVSVAQAALTSMSRQAAAGEMDGLKDSVSFAVRITLFVTIPAAVGLIVCATPIYSLMFMGGEFDYIKATQCGKALAFYSIGLSSVALVRVLAPAFYAQRDTRTPVMVALIAFIINLSASLALMGPLKHGGLALASSIAAFCNMGLLLYFLRRKIGRFGGRVIVDGAIRTILSTIPMAILVFWVLRFVKWDVTGLKMQKGLVLTVAVAGGAMLFMATAHLLRCREAREMTGMVTRRINRWRGIQHNEEGH
jgi:putative peptidoglycan lipid II flippase